MLKIIHNKIKVGNKVNDVVMRLKKMSFQELCEIYNKTNAWNWDARMGDEPDNWKQLAYYAIGRWKEKCIITRHSYLKPINNYIRNVVSEKELLRYHHIHNLHSTNEDFEMWWKRVKLEDQA